MQPQRYPLRIGTAEWHTAIERIGQSHSLFGDAYHLLLTVSWPGFLGIVTFAYLGLNVLFALAYIAGGNCLANMEQGSLRDAFFFSVQTLGTIGYGAMYPITLYANAIVTVESLVGLLFVAMATGLMFARFARPTARVLFANVATIAPFNGVPTLAVRVANQRQNQIVEAKMQIVLVRNEVSAEGQVMRRFHDLKLSRSQTPLFALTWTAMHPITTESPLFGMTATDLAEGEVEIIVMLTGMDETFAQVIHARHSYMGDEIVWNARFADVLSRLPDGRRRIDYRYFHQVIAIAEGSNLRGSSL